MWQGIARSSFRPTTSNANSTHTVRGRYALRCRGCAEIQSFFAAMDGLGAGRTGAIEALDDGSQAVLATVTPSFVSLDRDSIAGLRRSGYCRILVPIRSAGQPGDCRTGRRWIQEKHDLQRARNKA